MAAIVELIGPPGSGKSTIAAHLQELLAQTGLRALPARGMGQTILDRTGRHIPLDMVEVSSGFVFCLHYPALAGLVLHGQCRRPGSWKHRLLALIWLLRLGGMYHFLRRSMQQNEVAVFSEGLANHAVNFFTSDQQAPSADLIERYVQHLPRPELLVSVQVPVDTCLARLQGRQALPRRIQGLGSEAITAFVTHQAQAVEMVLGEAQRLGWPVLLVDNTVAADQVRAGLAEQWKHAGAPGWK